METNVDITASRGSHEAAIEGEGGPEGPVRVAQDFHTTAHYYC